MSSLDIDYLTIASDIRERILLHQYCEQMRSLAKHSTLLENYLRKIVKADAHSHHMGTFQK